jgi:hypothetical protein
METTDIRDVIRSTQDRILRNMLDLVPRDKRPEAERLIDQYRQSTRAISAMTPELDARYASCTHVIDAIKLYLQDAGQPATRSEIMIEVVRRGFRPQNAARTAGNISKSLTMYLGGRAARRNVIKQIGERIGLAEWPDSIFPVGEPIKIPEQD